MNFDFFIDDANIFLHIFLTRFLECDISILQQYLNLFSQWEKKLQLNKSSTFPVISFNKVTPST